MVRVIRQRSRWRSPKHKKDKSAITLAFFLSQKVCGFHEVNWSLIWWKVLYTYYKVTCKTWPSYVRGQCHNDQLCEKSKKTLLLKKLSQSKFSKFVCTSLLWHSIHQWNKIPSQWRNDVRKMMSDFTHSPCKA